MILDGKATVEENHNREMVRRESMKTMCGVEIALIALITAMWKRYKQRRAA